MDLSLSNFVLQFVQALKFETHIDNPLARFLLYLADINVQVRGELLCTLCVQLRSLTEGVVSGRSEKNFFGRCTQRLTAEAQTSCCTLFEISYYSNSVSLAYLSVRLLRSSSVKAFFECVDEVDLWRFYEQLSLVRKLTTIQTIVKQEPKDKRAHRLSELLSGDEWPKTFELGFRLTEFAGFRPDKCKVRITFTIFPNASFVVSSPAVWFRQCRPRWCPCGFRLLNIMTRQPRCPRQCLRQPQQFYLSAVTIFVKTS